MSDQCEWMCPTAAWNTPGLTEQIDPANADEEEVEVEEVDATAARIKQTGAWMQLQPDAIKKKQPTATVKAFIFIIFFLHDNSFTKTK